MNRSEQFVHSLARSAFMALWTYPNPIGKDGSKELCDVLVVCQPNVVIFSVKEIELRTDGDQEVQVERWKRRAIEESADQISGAERRLAVVDDVTSFDGSKGVSLGALEQRVVRRVAVAIGSSGMVPLESRDYGHGFVHVFDDRTLWLLLQELDTITDFVEYLAAREELLTGGFTGTILGSEEDLLAAYLVGVHSFDELKAGNYHLRVIAGSWDDFTQRPEYQSKEKANKVSYFWDQLIQQVHDDYAHGRMEFGEDLASVEAITRIMAREPRFYRRVLSKGVIEFLGNPKNRSRLALGNSGIAYVFLKQRHALPREDRVNELQWRCFVTRDWMEQRGSPGIVVGLATEEPEVGSGFSLDLCLFDAPEWGDEQRAMAAKLREEFGMFKNPQLTHYGEDEFPES
jgi:hypothetical protein